MYATFFFLASLLRRSDPTSSFLRGLNQEWLSDVQEFLHVGLPKLLFIALYAWALILLVNFITGRILKVAGAYQMDTRFHWSRPPVLGEAA